MRDLTLTEVEKKADAQAASASLFRSSRIVSALTLLSRLLGLARDWAMIAVFSGALWITDAFLFAFTIPNLFRRLFGEGALAAAFIPGFLSAREKGGDERAASLGGKILALLLLVTGALAGFGILGCTLANLLLGPSASGDRAGQQVRLTLELIATMLPFLCLICCSALLSAALQALRSFALPAAMSCILNLCFLAAFAYIAWAEPAGGDTRTIFYAALAVVGAGVLQVALQWPALVWRGFRFPLRLRWADEDVQMVIKAMSSTVLGLGVVQINVLVDGLIAYALSLRGEGGDNTYLYLGNRLMQLPLGILGVAVATTAFPYLAEHAIKTEYRRFMQILRDALRLTVFTVLPAGVGLAAVADPLVRLLFQKPDLVFSDAAVYQTAAVLACYASGLVFFAVQHLLTRAFYALQNFSTPVRVAGWMVVVNLALNLLLIHAPDPYRYLWEIEVIGLPDQRLGVVGLALSTTLTALLNVTILWLLLRRRLRPLAGVSWWDENAGDYLWSLTRMALASGLMGVFVYWVINSIPYEPETLYRAERCLVAIALGVIGYYGLCVVIPVPELNEILGRRSRSGDSD